MSDALETCTHMIEFRDKLAFQMPCVGTRKQTQTRVTRTGVLTSDNVMRVAAP